MPLLFSSHLPLLSFSCMKKNPPIIKTIALSLGGTVEDFVPERGCFYISIFGKRIFLERKISLTRPTNGATQLTRCKDITHKLLFENHLPTPLTQCFYQKTYDAKKAFLQIKKLRFPVVLKDAEGSQCNGVFTFIKTPSEASKKLEEELPKYRNMVVQEMVFGKEYRLLVLDEKIIGALELISPYVVGDGVSSLRMLIEKKQFTPKRKKEFYGGLEKVLKQQGVTFETVVAQNEIIYIKNTTSRQGVWKMRDVTAIVHPSIEKLCVKASKVVGKYLVGIDVICDDIAVPVTEQSFHILEINGKPDLYIHYHPTHGKTQNVIKDILVFMANNTE
jgi:cyanophycin synthetase